MLGFARWARRTSVQSLDGLPQVRPDGPADRRGADLERRTRGLESYATWLALAAAFSPVLVHLARNVADHPEDRITLLAPLLLLLALRSSASEHAEGRRDGAVAIGLGVALQTLGLFTDWWSIARLGLPVAALGLARWEGRPRIDVIALLFFAIPPPYSIVFLLSPALETAVAQATGAILHGVGFPVEASGFSLVAAAGRIWFRPMECGVALAFVLAELGWYFAARSRMGIGSALLRAALSSLLVIPLQPMVALISGALLGMGHSGAGQFWLTQGAWGAVSLAGLAWLHHRSAGVRSQGHDDESTRIRTSG